MLASSSTGARRATRCSDQSPATAAYSAPMATCRAHLSNRHAPATRLGMPDIHKFWVAWIASRHERKATPHRSEGSPQRKKKNFTSAAMRRVLSPGGRLLFVEHGLAPDKSVRRCQDLLTPAWRCLCRGCHLNRPIRTMIEATCAAIGSIPGIWWASSRWPSSMRGAHGHHSGTTTRSVQPWRPGSPQPE
jgi:hypothetical protein